MKFEEVLKSFTHDQQFEDLVNRFFLFQKAADSYRLYTNKLHPTLAFEYRFKVKLILDITQLLSERYKKTFELRIIEEFAYNTAILDDISKEEIFFEVDKEYLKLLNETYLAIFENIKKNIIDDGQDQPYEKAISRLTTKEMKFNGFPLKEDIKNFFLAEVSVFSNLEFEQQNVSKSNIDTTWRNHVNAFEQMIARSKEFHKKMLDCVDYSEKKSERAKTGLNFIVTAIFSLLSAVFGAMAAPQLAPIINSAISSKPPIATDIPSESYNPTEKLNQKIHKNKKSAQPVLPNSK